MKVPKVSAIILRGLFLYARCIGVVFFRLKRPKDFAMALEESWWNHSMWKWISIILRLIPHSVNVYTYYFFICHLENLVDQVLHCVRLVIITSSSLSMIHMQIFHGEEVIKLMNQYLRLFCRVTALAIRSTGGFGDARELWLILLSLGCQVQEIVFTLAMFQFAINQHNILSWSSCTYVIICSNMIMRISFIWYLSLGVLYSTLNDYLRSETQYNRRKQNLKNAKALFRKTSYLVTVLQEITNKYLLLNMLQTLLSMIAISYKMIVDHQLCQFWIWFYFVKIIVDLLVLSLAIEGAVNQLSYIRDLIPDVLFLSELTDWNRTMEIFITNLNLYQFRVRLVGLFDISNKLFPVVVAGMITYLVFIVQYIMQLKSY